MPLVRVVFSITLLLSLAACRTGPFAELRTLDFPPSDEPASAATRAPETSSASTAQPKVSPRAANPALSDPERLIGMNEDATLDLLGKPDSTGQEAQAQLWHYRRQRGCELVLFFYVDLTTRSRHVLAYENRVPPGAPAGLECGTERTAKRE